MKLVAFALAVLVIGAALFWPRTTTTQRVPTVAEKMIPDPCEPLSLTFTRVKGGWWCK